MFIAPAKKSSLKQSPARPNAPVMITASPMLFAQTAKSAKTNCQMEINAAAIMPAKALIATIFAARKGFAAVNLRIAQKALPAMTLSVKNLKTMGRVVRSHGNVQALSVTRTAISVAMLQARKTAMGWMTIAMDLLTKT